MKIETYQQQFIGPTESGLAKSLGGEKRGPLQIPQRGIGQSVMALVTTTMEIGEKIAEAQRVAEYSEAVVAAHLGLSNIEDQAKSDRALITSGDVEAHERYFTDSSNDLKAKISAGIKDHRAKRAFSLKFDEANLTARNRMKALGRSRIIDRGRAAIDGELQILQDIIVKNGDLEAIGEAEGIVGGKVAAGFFSAQEGTQLIKRFKHDSILGYWDRRILESPALAFEMLQQEPKSLKFLSENEKTTLMKKAKDTATVKMKEDTESRIYDELKGKYGNDAQRIIDYLEDPKNYKELPLGSRRYLIATFAAEWNRDITLAEHARNQTVRSELNNVYSLIQDGDVTGAADIINKSRAMDAPQKEKMIDAIKKMPWTTDQNKYRQVRMAIYQGNIAERAQIDDLRGHGISNTDADRLVNELEQKQKIYQPVISWFTGWFKSKYPAKDKLDMHLKYLEAGDIVLNDILEQEKSKGRPLTHKEAQAIAQGYIEDVYIKGEPHWWRFDPEVPAIEARLMQQGPWDPARQENIRNRASEPRITSPAETAGLDGILPREIQQRIAAQLETNGYPVTSENILTYYETNKDETEFKKNILDEREDIETAIQQQWAGEPVW